MEQNAEGSIPVEKLQSTKDIIRIPKLFHEEVTSAVSRDNNSLGTSLRNFLKNKSFEEQYTAEIKVLRDLDLIDG